MCLYLQLAFKTGHDKHGLESPMSPHSIKPMVILTWVFLHLSIPSCGCPLVIFNCNSFLTSLFSYHIQCKMSISCTSLIVLVATHNQGTATNTPMTRETIITAFWNGCCSSHRLLLPSHLDEHHLYYVLRTENCIAQYALVPKFNYHCIIFLLVWSCKDILGKLYRRTINQILSHSTFLKLRLLNMKGSLYCTVNEIILKRKGIRMSLNNSHYR